MATVPVSLMPVESGCCSEKLSQPKKLFCKSLGINAAEAQSKYSTSCARFNECTASDAFILFCGGLVV